MRSYTQNIDGLEKRSGVECSSGKGEVDGKGKGKETFGSNEEAKKEDESWPPSSQASTIAPPPSSYASISASPRMDSTPSPSSPSPPLSSLPPTSSSPGPQADSVIFPSSPANLDKKTTKNVQLHGDLHKVRCTSCQTTYDFEDEFVEMMREGVAVQCPACEMKSELSPPPPSLLPLPRSHARNRVLTGVKCLFVQVPSDRLEVNGNSHRASSDLPSSSTTRTTHRATSLARSSRTT